MPVNLNQWFKELDQAKKLISNLPRLIGNEMLNFSKDRFKDQAWHDNQREAWPKRKDSSSRALLIKTGRLRRSIRIVSASKSAVVIGTDVPYAQIHNEGGTVQPTVTEKMRKFAWSMTKKDPKNADMWKGLALTKKTSLKIYIPKRQYLGASAKFHRDLNEFLKNEIKKALK